MAVATWGKYFQLHCVLWLKTPVPICFICLEYTKDMKDKVGTCPGEPINYPNKAFVQKPPFSVVEKGVWNKGLIRERKERRKI